MPNAIKPYSIDDIATAIADYNHAKDQLTGLLRELNPKRASVASLEKQEMELIAEVERCAGRVRSIAKALG